MLDYAIGGLCIFLLGLIAYGVALAVVAMSPAPLIAMVLIVAIIGSPIIAAAVL